MGCQSRQVVTVYQWKMAKSITKYKVTVEFIKCQTDNEVNDRETVIISTLIKSAIRLGNSNTLV